MNYRNNKHKLLNKMMKILFIFLIVFSFAVKPVNADIQKYSDFDFDEFAEQTKDYWIRACMGEKEEDRDRCVDKIIKQQRKFYTQLYKILASKQRKGYFIEDSIIIATIFFEYELSFFNDGSNAYNIDDNGDDGDNATAEYFEQERDSLKLLINAMIGYEKTCYGIQDSYEVTDESGVTTSICDSGSLNEDGKCYTLIYSESLSFWEKFASGVKSFFGLFSHKQSDCEAKAYEQGFTVSDESVSAQKKVLVDGYWDFLEQGDYFDRKPHLWHRYNAVLEKAGVESLDQLDKEKYAEDLVKVRKQIVKEIKELLEEYNKGRTNPGYLGASNNDNYWWPIGSAEVTEQNGKVFAAGDPVSVTITSNYGIRVHPVYGTTRKHYGVDLAGVGGNGNTNIIAAKNGTVVAVNTGCFSTSNQEDHCGGGYGNYVQIQHSDGLYTFYGHMHENSITVHEGESVVQGQVIGKMGTSGVSTGTHLHFEVRTGTSQSTAVDPLDYIDPNNPRPSSLSSLGELIGMLIGFEGAGPASGDSYVVYCNSGDVPTAGPGVTLTHNAATFASVGYPLVGSPPYSNYCGSTIPKSVVEQVFAVEVEKWAEYVRGKLASAGLSFSQNQIDALTDLCYNAGYRMDDFLSAYSRYGNSQSLCSSWWNNYYIRDGSGTVLGGLKTRRYKECNLTFLQGIYDGSY